MTAQLWHEVVNSASPAWCAAPFVLYARPKTGADLSAPGGRGGNL